MATSRGCLSRRNHVRCGVRLGHCGDVRCTTALPPKGEVDSRSYHVAKFPLPDIQAAALQFSVLTALGAWRRLRGPLDLDHAHIISIMRILVDNPKLTRCRI